MLGLLLLIGCSESLFDADPGRGSGGAGPAVPLTCPTGCVANAAGDFNGTAGGVGNHWRYVDDHRDRSWTPMAAAAMAMTGADPGNHITTCAAKPGAPACSTLPGALLISSAGAMSAADPAIELTAPAAQVIQLHVYAFVAAGDDQTIRLYRNSREDVLLTAVAAAGAMFDQSMVLDALAGDRFLVALAPKTNGATDVALQVFASATGATFPSTCQVALPFAAAVGNTVDNLCGNPFTHSLFDGDMDTAPALAVGPFPELGSAADFGPDAYFSTADPLDRTHDTTLQFWVKLRDFVNPYNAWPFSDVDLDATGGLGVAILNDPEPKLYVETCDTATPTTNTFASVETAYPTDGSWQFVRVVHTGGQIYVCLNGARKAMLPVAAGRLQSTYAAHLGSDVRWSPQGAFFDGELDDVRVFTGALPCD